MMSLHAIEHIFVVLCFQLSRIKSDIYFNFFDLRVFSLFDVGTARDELPHC